jgi:hypothetical protein
MRHDHEFVSRLVRCVSMRASVLCRMYMYASVRCVSMCVRALREYARACAAWVCACVRCVSMRVSVRVRALRECARACAAWVRACVRGPNCCSKLPRWLNILSASENLVSRSKSRHLQVGHSLDDWATSNYSFCLHTLLLFLRCTS